MGKQENHIAAKATRPRADIHLHRRNSNQELSIEIVDWNHNRYDQIHRDFQWQNSVFTRKFFNLHSFSAGDIRVYVEHTLKPIIEYKDAKPLQIKYFGFSSLGFSLARYFYDCSGDKVYTKSQLNTRCQHANVSSALHTQFHSIPSNSLADTDRYSIEISMYLAGSHDAHIVVASDNSFNSIRNGYEFGMYTVWYIPYTLAYLIFRLVWMCSIDVDVFFFLQIVCINKSVIGDDMNRHISIYKIGNRMTNALTSNGRRADIFIPNEMLNLFVRISRRKCIYIINVNSNLVFHWLLCSNKDLNLLIQWFDVYSWENWSVFKTWSYTIQTTCFCWWPEI